MHCLHPGSGSSQGRNGRRRKQTKYFLILFKSQLLFSCHNFWFINVELPALAEKQSALKIKPEDEGKTRSPLFSATWAYTEVWKDFSGYLRACPKGHGRVNTRYSFLQELSEGKGGCWRWEKLQRLQLVVLAPQAVAIANIATVLHHYVFTSAVSLLRRFLYGNPLKSSP